MTQLPETHWLLRIDRRGRVLALLAPVTGQYRAPELGTFLADLAAEPSAGPLLDFLLALSRYGAAVSAPLELTVSPLESATVVLAGLAVEAGFTVWQSADEASARTQGTKVVTALALLPPSLSPSALRLFGETETSPEAELGRLRRELLIARDETQRLREEVALLKTRLR